MEIKFDDKGLVPAVIQDVETKNVLMLGYMNQEAFEVTKEKGKVTFFSRSKQRLWTKGEESGNFLELVSIENDCDNDSLLIQARPVGPTCHKGDDTCWAGVNDENFGFLSTLETTIKQRRESGDTDGSYVAKMFAKGINKIAQKVGEEAVETVIEAIDNNKKDFLYEAGDLLFHYLMLLQAMGFTLTDITTELKKRHK